MKTRGVKKSPEPKKGIKAPSIVSEITDGEVGSLAVASEAGVPIQNDYVDSGVNAETGVLDVDLDSAGVNVEEAEGEGEEDAGEGEGEGEGEDEGKGEGEGEGDIEMDNKEDEDDDVEDEEVEDEDEHREGEEINDEEEDIKDTVVISDDHPMLKSDDKHGDVKLLVMQYSKGIYEQRKKKRLDVFIGGLSKDATEEEIRAEFEKIGTVTEVRLIRNLKNGKTKGYAFVRYSDPSDALKAVDELNTVEVHGQPCRVVLSEENDILFLGNIGKDWKKENVIEALQKYEIEGVEDLTLIEDPEDKESHQGFGFLEFSTHKDALDAFKKLQKREAVFGCERSAKVAWAQLWDEPDESVMLQVRTVFLDGVPSTWDEQKVKELFGSYGEIEKVDLARKRSTSKKRKFGFIKYATREAALSCIEAITNSEVSDGDQKVKLKANLAKPLPNWKGLRRGIRGGFLVSQEIVDQEGGGQKAAESKGLSKKRMRNSSSIKRKGKKAKTIKQPALALEDKVIEDTPPSVARKPLQGRPSKVTPQQKSQKLKKTNLKYNSGRVAHNGTYPQSHGRAGDRRYSTDGRREFRGRKRTFSDLGENPRYTEVSQNSRLQLARAENVQYVAVPGPQYAVPAPQYARVPYYEGSQRVPVGGVAQYAVVQSVPTMPATIVQRQPTYAVYGTSSSPVYQPGGYSYAQVGRGGTYIAPSYDSQNVHYY